jgi:hypothetical protein
MKQAFIDATLPELKGGKMYKTARGRGCTGGVAISRAVKNLLKQCGRHRITELKLTVIISEVPKEEKAA